MDNFTFEKRNVNPASRTRGSSLSQAFAAFNIHGETEERNRSHPGLVLSPLPAITEAIPSRNSASNMEPLQITDTLLGSPAQNIPGATSSTESGSESDSEPKAVGDISEKKLRAYCSGPQPPTFLKPGGNLPPILKAARRRSTLADNPEIDYSLAASRIEISGQKYLPLTAQTFKMLSPLWTGAKPIADLDLFKYLTIDQETNATHAAPMSAALERIGGHCQQLAVTGAYEHNITTGNDWVNIFRLLPNLKSVTLFVNNAPGVSVTTAHHIIESVKAALNLVYEHKRTPTLTVA